MSDYSSFRPELVLKYIKIREKNNKQFNGIIDERNNKDSKVEKHSDEYARIQEEYNKIIDHQRQVARQEEKSCGLSIWEYLLTEDLSVYKDSLADEILKGKNEFELIGFQANSHFNYYFKNQTIEESKSQLNWLLGYNFKWLVYRCRKFLGLSRWDLRATKSIMDYKTIYARKIKYCYKNQQLAL